MNEVKSVEDRWTREQEFVLRRCLNQEMPDDLHEEFEWMNDRTYFPVLRQVKRELAPLVQPVFGST